MPEISVIIIAMNEERYIGHLLQSLSPQLKKGDEIILIDSNSKDRTREIALEYKCKVYQIQPSGIAPAKNLGARKARCEIMAFLDADCVVSPDWLERIRKHFSEKRYSAIAGLDLYTCENPLRRRVYNVYSKLVYLIARISYALGGKPWLPANNLATYKKLFLDIGGYANIVCEDAELMNRWPRAARVYYDYEMIVHFSDRRFKKEGFVKTLFLWLVADIRAWSGRGNKAKTYSRV
jgi:glycosyltransferase involved in cell wall biosynthesis